MVKVSNQSNEGFYLDENGVKQDAAFHEEMLAGDHSVADAIGIAVVRRLGLLSEEQIQRLYGKPEK